MGEMLQGAHTFTPTGRQRRADYDEVCNWILSSWQRVRLSTIVNGFAKSGIANEHLADMSDTDSDDSCSSDDGKHDGANEERLLEILELLQESDTETETSFHGFEDDDDDDDKH